MMELHSAICDALDLKHHDEVMVWECKDGPSQYSNGHRRLDLWVMPRSWAHPETTGYEIKVTRADFLRDDKWPAYLPLCHRLYFAAPKGIILPNEVPAECGLMELVGKRLVVRKKAPVRQLALPEELLRYILMCRSVIKGEGATEGREERLRAIVEGRRAAKEQGRETAYEVGRLQRELRRANERIEYMQRDHAAARARVEELEKGAPPSAQNLRWIIGDLAIIERSVRTLRKQLGIEDEKT